MSLWVELSLDNLVSDTDVLINEDLGGRLLWFGFWKSTFFKYQTSTSPVVRTLFEKGDMLTKSSI